MKRTNYFAEKMRLYRRQNPLSQKKYVYIIKIGNQEFAFLRKSDIVIQRQDIESLKNNTNIIKTF